MSKEQGNSYDSEAENVVCKASGCLQREIYLEKGSLKRSNKQTKKTEKSLIYRMESLFYMSSLKISPSQIEENKKYFPYNHRLHTKRQKQASQMNGVVFRKD